LTQTTYLQQFILFLTSSLQRRNVIIIGTETDEIGIDVNKEFAAYIKKGTS